MRRRKLYSLILGMMLIFCGCSVERTEEQKLKDLAFTVLEESQIPQDLKVLIEEKKQNEFKLTFDTEDAKYIAMGYGTQQTNGYSISVEELYETRNAIYINPNLLGPAKGEAVSEVESYPYIVVKIDYLDKSVVFE